jgi:glycosyltransferase involved in cell wall biosynthesis
MTTPQASAPGLAVDAPVPPAAPKVALVHDYLLVLRGAERTFAALADLWPSAPIATLLYDPEAVGERFAGHPLTTSRWQRSGLDQRRFRALLPLLPAAAERLPVGGHDVVVSSSSAFAHGVRPDDGAVHVCYSHTPFRYAWYAREAGLGLAPRALRPALGPVLDRIRRWDVEASERVTRYVANSAITQERLLEYYGREAPIVAPPVEIERFWVGEPQDHLLVVGELIRHKRVDAVLEAARRAGRPVRVVGDGPARAELEARYGDVATFLGRLDDAALAREYAGCLALVQGNVEEFGITAVEAQAAGRPVVAMAAGGALETVRDGVTGVLVAPGDGDALAEALRATDFTRFRATDCVVSATRFSVEAFQRRMRRIVEKAAGLGPAPAGDRFSREARPPAAVAG